MLDSGTQPPQTPEPIQPSAESLEPPTSSPPIAIKHQDYRRWLWPAMAVMIVILLFIWFSKLGDLDNGQLLRPATEGITRLNIEESVANPQIIIHTNGGGILTSFIPYTAQWRMPDGKVLLFSQTSLMVNADTATRPLAPEIDIKSDLGEFAPLLEDVQNFRSPFEGDCQSYSLIDQTIVQDYDTPSDLVKDELNDLINRVAENRFTDSGCELKPGYAESISKNALAWQQRHGAVDTSMGLGQAQKSFYDLYYRGKRGCIAGDFRLLNPATGKMEQIGGETIHNLKNPAVIPINEAEVVVIGSEMEDLDCMGGLPSGFEQSRNSNRELTAVRYNLKTATEEKVTLKNNAVAGLLAIPTPVGAFGTLTAGAPNGPLVLDLPNERFLISIPAISFSDKASLQYIYTARANTLELTKNPLPLPTDRAKSATLKLKNGDTLIYNRKINSLQYFDAKRQMIRLTHRLGAMNNLEMTQISANQVLLSNPTPNTGKLYSDFDRGLKGGDKVFIFDMAKNELFTRLANLDGLTTEFAMDDGGGAQDGDRGIGYRLVAIGGKTALATAFTYNDLPIKAGLLDLIDWTWQEVKPTSTNTASFDSPINKASTNNLYWAVNLGIGDWLFMSGPKHAGNIVPVEMAATPTFVTFRTDANVSSIDINTDLLTKSDWEKVSDK